MDSSSLHPSPTSRWLPCSPLGSGSFGHVSLALNLDDSTFFAVKSSLSASSQELAALENELSILQSLQSPFIIHCLGAEFSATKVGSKPTVRNLFLEYMDGGSLADALRQAGGRLREEPCIQRFTRSILQGLAYLHENGIVHSDIKSQNILIGSSGVKIADFGTARRLGEAWQKDGSLRGTPLWMAPEVALGGEPMPASDIWSLGCTVVEMLQGRPPWGHVSSLSAALFKVGCSGETPPFPESISAEAEDFLLKCLQRDPKARCAAKELLKHPFVCNLKEEAAGEVDCLEMSCRKVQPSPRSTLDFFHSDSESDWEEESTVRVVPMLCSPSYKTQPGVNPLEAPSLQQGSNWIVVKGGEGWCEGRHMPFTQAAGAGEVGLQVTRASEVSFASAEFLRNRVKIVVG